MSGFAFGGGFGVPVFVRELLAQARRTRTYALQTVFLGLLVLALIPLWPASSAASGAAIADQGRLIFEWGGYLQVLLLTLLAPAVTANAIVEEKEKNTLDLLLLTSAGPFAIVWGKFFSRLFGLAFLLFLSLPILFALLTLGGIGSDAILVEFVILIAYSILGAGLGIFLSTILPGVTQALITGYVLLSALLAAPAIAIGLGFWQTRAGTFPLLAAELSPLYDVVYLFQTSKFVATESFPRSWWVAPLWTSVAGLALVMLSGAVLPLAHRIERALSLRRFLDAFDRVVFLLLRFRWRALLRLLRQRPLESDDAAPVEHRHVGTQNPIYWMETCVNTIGRNRYWWRVNLALLVALLASYLLFHALLPDSLADVTLHRYMVATLTGILVLLSTVIAATTVSREREDGTLVLMASTPLDCRTYVQGKVRGIARNIVFLSALPFIHAAIWILAGVIHPLTFVYLLVSIPFAVVAQITQGIFVSLMQPTTPRAIIAALILISFQAVLPFVCCLPTFNLPLTSYYLVEPASGLGSLQQIAGAQGNYLAVLFVALLFSAGTQVGYTLVVYSLIRSGFDRYIGRAY
ncbi:MAG: hypothetical protein D6731_26165 [Planctomycetota bacterium]|nr:MAG: hypothetical protein D6731_26165 [Planctomycetota bacterium]